MSRLKSILVLLIAFSAISFAIDSLLVPQGLPPLLNGINGENEWLDANAIEWEEADGAVLLKQDSLYFYMCVDDYDTSHSGIDLFIDNMTGDMFVLHVSSAHGQKRMIDDTWGEMDYCSQELWTSNIVQNIFVDGKMKFLSPEVFEFQIDKKLLTSNTFKFIIHLKRPDKWYPESADTLSSNDWMEVELNQ